MDQLLKQSYTILDNLRMPNGLYIASPSNHYHFVWIRDNCYMALPYLDKPCDTFIKTYHRLLDLFKTYEWKINYAIERKPKHVYEYIHARYTAMDVLEIHDQEWGHTQHDSIGAFLFGMAQGLKRGKNMFRDKNDIRITKKLVDYLGSIEYWSDPDHGIWEEWREIHLSSVGACVAGLKAISHFVDVPDHLILNGMKTCFDLFPRESNDKRVDLALLSLIYPYDLFGMFGAMIVHQVERYLVRERGVIRYEGDSYFSTLEQDHGRNHSRHFYYGTEAEWCFGFPWLSICHLKLGNVQKAEDYLTKTKSVALSTGAIPELYFSGSNVYNHNTPLGWSNAMYIVAQESYQKGCVHL